MQKLVNSNEKRSWVYIILITSTLVFHIFNHLYATASLKVFHVFAAAAIVGAFMLERHSDKLLGVFRWVLVWGFLSTILSPIEVAYFAYVKFLIVALSVYFIAYVPIDRLIKAINIVTPIVLLALVRQYFLEPIYRYQGFYEDPNYFCATLLVLYFFIQLYWKQQERLWVRIGLLVEIALIFFLVTTTISRTGLVCLLLMTLVFWWNLFVKHKFKATLGAILTVFVVYYFYGDYIALALQEYVMRETTNKDTVGSASELRWEISMRGISYLFSHPLFLLQGIGIGTYSSAVKVLSGWHASTHHIDHNTITSWFSEQGLIGLLLLLRFFYLLFLRIKHNVRLKSQGLHILVLCVLSVFLFFSLSINQTDYLPFWFLIFTLANLSKIQAD